MKKEYFIKNTNLHENNRVRVPLDFKRTKYFQMKNINILVTIFFASILITISSCKNFLDLNPISLYNAGSFYSKDTDFKLAVSGAYYELQDLYKNYFVYILEGRSDNVDVWTNYNPGSVSMFIDDQSTPDLLSIWKESWVLIDRCNAIIDQVDAGTFDIEAYRSYYKGEAYFLRGYAYFQLGWLYGGVPLIGHQMKVAEIKATARSTQEETFAFAAKDLIQATELLPKTWATSELGKATKYAAEGISCPFIPVSEEIFTSKTSSGRHHIFRELSNGSQLWKLLPG